MLGFACSSPQKQTPEDEIEEAAAAQEAAEDAKQDTHEAKPAYSEPIDPETIKRFPHLSGFSGNVVLGNSFVQAVLAGVSPEVDMSTPWEPAILAFFELRDDRWEPLDSLASIKLMRPGVDNPKFTISAVDTTVNKKQGRATAQVFYRQVGQLQVRSFALYSLSQNSRILTVGFGENLSTDKYVANNQQKWALQINSYRGQFLNSPATNAGKNPHSRMIMHFFDKDVLAVESYSNLKVSTQANTLNGQPADFLRGLGWNGFEFLIGQESAREALFRAAMIEHCSKNQEVLKVLWATELLPAKQEFLEQCVNLQPKAFLSLAFEKESSEISALPRRLFFLNEKDQPTAYLGFASNSKVELPLAGGTKVVLRDITTGKIWGKDQPIVVSGDHSEIIQIEPRQIGEVEISSKSSDGSKDEQPVLLKIKHLVGENGTNATAEVFPDSDMSKFSDSTFLIRSWPVRLRAPAGQYNLDVFRGSQGKLCSILVTVNNERPSQATCPIPQAEAALSSTFDLATAPSKKDQRATYAALEVTGVGQISDSGSELDETADLVPRLEVVDEETKLKLSLFPLSEKTANEWQEFLDSKKGSSPKTKTIELLSEFAASKAPDAILELSCPGDHIANVDYIRLVEQLNPNALQLYGCNTNSPDRFVGLYRQLFKQGQKPTLVTSIAGGSPKWNRYHLPKMVLNKTNVGNLEAFQKEARSGDYTISSGSLIQISKTDLKNERLDLAMTLKRYSGTQPKLVKIFSESGLLYRVPVEFGELKEKNLAQTLRFKSSDHYLRIEVLGPTDEILAATNFIGLRAPASSDKANGQN